MPKIRPNWESANKQRLAWRRQLEWEAAQADRERRETEQRLRSSADQERLRPKERVAGSIPAAVTIIIRF